MNWVNPIPLLNFSWIVVDCSFNETIKIMKFFLTFFFLISSNILFSQNHREFNREANKSFKNEDYINATLKTIKSLQIKNNFKSAVKLFEKSLSIVNKSNISKINALKAECIPYKDEQSAIKMKEIFIIYSGLDQIQSELLIFPKKVKLKNKNIIAENTYDYNNDLKMVENLLAEYNTITATNFYDEGNQILSRSTSKSDYRRAYRMFVKSDSYIDNFNNVKDLITKTLELGQVKIAIAEMKNFTNYNGDYLLSQIKDQISEKRFTKIITSANVNDITINFEGTNPVYIQSIVEADLKSGKSDKPLIEEIFELEYSHLSIKNVEVISSQEFKNSVQVEERVNDSTTTTVTKSIVGRIYNLYGTAHLEVNVEIWDALNGDVLFKERISSNFYEYKNSFINYRGSRRALPSQYLLQPTSRPRDPDLKKVVEGQVLRRIKNIINLRYKN